MANSPESQKPTVPGTRVPVRYATVWQDGLGARGWKLDLPGLGADVIAATPYPGERIPTSVFVHDIVDHHLCGFALSGYRDEAGALIQLAQRTGSDPLADFRQIIDEDLLPGAFESADWRELLPRSLVERVDAAADPRAGMAALRTEWGDGVLRALFSAGFVDVGWALAASARAAWESHGLDYARRPATALALQELFEWMDATVQQAGWEQATGAFTIAPDAVAFEFSDPAAGWSRKQPVPGGGSAE